MPDWPAGYVLPERVAISTFGTQSLAGIVQNNVFLGAASAVWPVANLAIYTPIWIERGGLAQKMAVQVGTQSGNMDVGIYSETGTRLVSAGTTAVGAAGLQTFDIADTVLDQGTYYLAMSVDNGVAAFIRVVLPATVARVCGVQQQSTAFVLPATATFATYAQAYLPWITVQFGSVL